MKFRHVALATSQESPDLNRDDRLLAEALGQRHVRVSPRVWSLDVNWADVDAVVIRSCSDYAERCPAFLTWVDELTRRGIRVLNGADVLRWNTDKRYLRELAGKGIPIIPTIWVEQDSNVASVLHMVDRSFGNKLVVKPAVGNDARGVLVTDQEHVAEAIEQSRAEGPRDLLIQPFLPAVIEEGEWSLVFLNSTFSHAVLKTPANGDFRAQHTHGGSYDGARPPEGVLRAAVAAISAAPAGLYARVDVLRHEDVYAVSEISMVEPFLFLEATPEAPGRFADAIIAAAEAPAAPACDDRQALIDQRLDALFEDLHARQRRYLGYPNSLALKNGNLGRFLDLPLNNVGDPAAGNNMLNTFEAERQVVAFFADLLHAPADDRWGYVTNGGTEGNMYGLWMARQRHPDAVVYYSEDTHYSIAKILRILGLKGARIRSRPDGTIDLRQLTETAACFRDYPAIWNANIGTTMKGAVDSIEGGLQAFRNAGIADVHIHCDAALFGAMLPFVADAPRFDFRLPVASIAISGHKFLGSPIPSGIVISRSSALSGGHAVEYIGSRDTTISGSRDGFSVLILWQEILRLGREGLSTRVRECLAMTRYALETLANHGIGAWANPFSNTIMFERPSDALVRRWHLAVQGDLAHIIMMPGMTRQSVAAFVGELDAEMHVSAPVKAVVND